MSWYNYIDNVLVLVAIPYLIWILWQVRKIDKELNKQRKELLELMLQNDKKMRGLKND